MTKTATQTKKFSKDVAELACQIVFEYPDWTSEHVDEMHRCGECSCDVDELGVACEVVAKLQREGLDYDAILEAVSAAVDTIELEISVHSIHPAMRYAAKAGLKINKKCNNGGVTWICDVTGPNEKFPRFRRFFEYGF